MKKLVILGSVMGVLLFGAFTQGTPGEATTVNQPVKSKMIFLKSDIPEFPKKDIQQTNALKNYKGDLIILASINPNPKYELKIGEVDINGTGFYNVQPVTLNKIDSNLSLINVSKNLGESALIMFYVEKSNPNVTVDYFFVNGSMIK
ncbi:hypothetical protein [Candidatus Enterococcus mansonii]|uniref:Uncharacterized protein n=1 Tax=Candidatus Enterococcus mansonii TaxID=1834181 RepID=A0A242C834_9ENTE|nr:hypothetical protein [Enterococcus sp. 4G2_DIV0659]OTO05952.1 hypothetical protein A5880_003127 [Enterococcus sp. 4G2_DIV0659]